MYKTKLCLLIAFALLGLWGKNMGVQLTAHLLSFFLFFFTPVAFLLAVVLKVSLIYRRIWTNVDTKCFKDRCAF